MASIVATVDDIIDPGAIELLRQIQQPGGPNVIAMVVDSYCTDAPKLIERVRTGLQSNDVQALTRAAHSLKSSSASLGAKRVASLAKEIEMLSRANELTPIDALIEEVEAEFERRN